MTTRTIFDMCLITGALGSGKTTLLNKLLQCPELSGAMVLINEFGDVGLDHEIVREVKEDVLLLSSGCLCCSLKGDLRDELVTLVESLLSGEVSISGPIIIETTGLADPVPILQLINTDEVLSHHLAIKHVATVVDALHCRQQSGDLPEVANQITLADILILSKIDLASVSDQAETMALIESLNPLAVRHELIGQKGTDDLVAAFAGSHAAYRFPDELPPTSGHRSLDGIENFDFVVGPGIERDNFFHWVQLLVQSQGENLLRMKGTIPFADRACYVHSTGPLFYPPVPVADDQAIDVGRLICIGRNLDAAGIEASFRARCEEQAPRGRRLERMLRQSSAPQRLNGDVLNQARKALSTVFVPGGSSAANLWNVHNPWSVAAGQIDAWAILDLCEDPRLLSQVTDRLGADVNLLDTEVITQKTHWLATRGDDLVADEARYFPVDPTRAVACRFPIAGPGLEAGAVLSSLADDWICPASDEPWAVLIVYFAASGEHFDRSRGHPANICRSVERPLENLAAMPIWLVAGEDRGGNNYAIGYNRPRPEWLQASAA